jgi:hypothetical protein
MDQNIQDHQAFEGREGGEKVSYFLPGFGAHRDFNRSDG